MKILHLALLLPLLAILNFCETSSIVGRQTRTKTEDIGNRDKSETPYVCLDASNDVPACNFGAEERAPENLSRRRRDLTESVIDLNTGLKASGMIEDDEQLSTAQVSDERPRGTTIVYKVVGCIPSRLPFNLPICTRQDSVGRIVEVRRLFPFKIADSSARNPGPPRVFPEIDMDQWHRFIQVPSTYSSNIEDIAGHINKMPREVGEEVDIDVAKRKIQKRRKADLKSLSKKKAMFTKLKKIAQKYELQNMDENGILSKIPSSYDWQQRLENDRSSDTDSYKTRGSLFNRRVDTEREDSSIRGYEAANDFFMNARDEFPYAKAIPYDPQKLSVGLAGSEFPYTHAIPYDPEKLRVARRESEFPYSRAIPYDPKKLDERKSGDDDERSISFHSRQLKVAEIEMQPFNSRVVPFDSSMLDAAKDGGIFPYGKAIPDDTSKSLDMVDFSRNSDTEREAKVPVRQTRTSWNTEFPIYVRKLQMIKDNTRLDKIQAGKEVQENVIDTGNVEDFPSLNGNIQISGKTRVARKAMEPNDFSSLSTAGSNTEHPSRWIEFPYSKAIAFDPQKLRRPRSAMDFYVEMSNAIPYDFPYAKAIAYDPSKLTTFRRKNSKSLDDWSMPREQNWLERLKRSSMSSD